MAVSRRKFPASRRACRRSMMTRSVVAIGAFASISRATSASALLPVARRYSIQADVSIRCIRSEFLDALGAAHLLQVAIQARPAQAEQELLGDRRPDETAQGQIDSLLLGFQAVPADGFPHKVIIDVVVFARHTPPPHPPAPSPRPAH